MTPHRNRRSIWAVSLILVISITALIIGVTASTGGETTPGDPNVPKDFSAALEANGLSFTPVSQDEASKAAVDANFAEATARELSGYRDIPADEIHVYVGRLTELNRLDPGDPKAERDPAVQPPAQDTLAYGVQIAGRDVSETPRGGPSGPSLEGGEFSAPPADADEVHREITVFINADTGLGIVSTTFR